MFLGGSTFLREAAVALGLDAAAGVAEDVVAVYPEAKAASGRAAFAVR